MKILIIEDEKELAQSIGAYLTGEQYLCEYATTFKEAVEKIELYEYDCILLDLMLPGGDGIKLLEELKAMKVQTGIIIISAKNAVEDKIKGLQIGADDYLAKPFHLPELAARIYSVVRRKNFDNSNTIQQNEIRVDLLAKMVFVNEKEIALTRKEFDILLYFISNKNKVISKNALAEHLSGDVADMFDNYDFVYAHIKNLKKKADRGRMRQLPENSLWQWLQMGYMNKLLNRSLKSFVIYAALVLAGSISCIFPGHQFIVEIRTIGAQHNFNAGSRREDRLLLVGAVTLLTVIFFILLLAGFILLNRRISRRLWQPFYNSLAQIKNFSLEQKRVISFEKSAIEEFDQLNQSLDKLITGNIAAYNQQKEFAENASHELQTPLAIVQSKLELLMQSQSLTREQYNIIEDTLKALARVSRVNKNLLLLTKIENSQYMEKDTINVSALLENLTPQFETIAAGDQIRLITHFQPAVTITGNRDLVEVLLNNLITNAIRYSSAGSNISLELSINSFIITNPGDSPLQSEQLFKRFATASSHHPGTGLGLALVKQICDRYNWKIEYMFKDRQHVFLLHFHSDFIPNCGVTLQELLLLYEK